MAKPIDSTNAILRKCSVAGCDRPRWAVGMCQSHRAQARRGEAIRPIRYCPKAERKGQRRAFLEAQLGSQSDSCVPWPFFQNGDGYGVLLNAGKLVVASRLMTELAQGPAPFAGAHAAHSCGLKSCVNPNHLRWATALENNRDKVKQGVTCRQHRLTRAQAIAIKRDNRSIRTIATEFDCTPVTVMRIKKGRTWRNLP